MTPVLCAAALGEVAGVGACRPEPDMHVEECVDESCCGCYPRLANVGFLCDHHAKWVEAALDQWGDWFRLVEAAGGKLVSSSGGGGTPLGFVPLTGLDLALDELERLRASQGAKHLHVWVSDHPGAVDALRWARAAYGAYVRFETEPQTPRLEKAPCPHCGEITIGTNPMHEDGPWKIVDCVHCGETIWRELFDVNPTVLSRQCDQRMHGLCSLPECTCPCHE